VVEVLAESALLDGHREVLVVAVTIQMSTGSSRVAPRRRTDAVLEHLEERACSASGEARPRRGRSCRGEPLAAAPAWSGEHP
jgi:hypothetical protein